MNVHFGPVVAYHYLHLRGSPYTDVQGYYISYSTLWFLVILYYLSLGISKAD